MNPIRIEAHQAFYKEETIRENDKKPSKTRFLIYDRDKSINGFYSQFIRFLRTEDI